ncbi:dermonecrotic toxin domain-containing protein [Pseudomonas rubra]|uniref:dermonecrotic toxin domain-containing protein n=1 Tax=Pseudomonas rubra TaxID=2942627 RepID=UPI0030822DCB
MPTLSTDNPHHALLSQRLPGDVQHFSNDHWAALRSSLHPAQGLPGSEADWFANAAPYLKDALLDSQAQLHRSQQALARSLKGLQSIAGFAEPLLRARLLADHGFNASLPASELVRVYQEYHWIGSRYLYSHDRQPLLEAALHNFGDDVSFSADSALALSADIEVEPITVSSFVTISPDLPAHALHLPSERYRIKRLALSPQAFAQSCRQLDLGRQYQNHLQALYENPANRDQVREQGIAVYRDQLRVALALAELRHQLDRPAIAAVRQLLDGTPGRCWLLGVLDVTLHDALVIDAADAGVLLYLPGAAQPLAGTGLSPPVHWPGAAGSTCHGAGQTAPAPGCQRPGQPAATLAATGQCRPATGPQPHRRAAVRLPARPPPGAPQGRGPAGGGAHGRCRCPRP